jgi:predicted MFS family arabinose efflux permease
METLLHGKLSASAGGLNHLRAPRCGLASHDSRKYAFLTMRVAPGAFRSLSVPNWRIFFFSQLVSLVGSWIHMTGLAWLVLHITGSPLAFGTVTALQFTPVAALTLFGGVLADRFPKRKVLIASETMALLQAGALGALVQWGHPTLAALFPLAVVQGVTMAVVIPTRQSFVVELVGRERLPNAVALYSSVFNLARLLGPAIGGLTIAKVGMAATFWLDAVSFVPVIIAYFCMRPADLYSAPARVHAGPWAEIASAVSYTWRTPPILLVMLLIAFVGTFGFNFSTQIPLVARFILRVGPERFGMLTSCMGVGSLAAALVQATVARQPSRMILLTASCGFVVLLGAVALSHTYWLTGVLLAALGVAAVAVSTTANTTVQLAVPDDLRGRVMSLYVLLFACSTPLGGWLTGFFAQNLGVASAVALDAGLSGIGVAAAFAYHLRVRSQSATSGS